MVGHWFLVPVIGVRVPVSELERLTWRPCLQVRRNIFVIVRVNKKDVNYTMDIFIKWFF